MLGQGFFPVGPGYVLLPSLKTLGKFIFLISLSKCPQFCEGSELGHMKMQLSGGYRPFFSTPFHLFLSIQNTEAFGFYY